MSSRSEKIFPRIKIQQQGRQSQRMLRKGDRITIGMNPENDVVLVGKDVPRKHTLLERRNSKCLLHLCPGMEGEIRVQNSSLTFNDLLMHDLLPKKHDDHLLSISPGRAGFVKIGDAHIEFNYDAHQTAMETDSYYGWRKASSSAVGRDLLFKFLLLFLFAFEIVFHLSIRGYQVKEPDRVDFAKVPERFARFIVKPPQQPKIETTSTVGTTAASQETQDEGTEKSKSNKKPKKGSGGGGGEKALETKGVLGLIAGVGASRQRSDAIGFLVDHGMVKELDQMLGNVTLKSGRGKGSGSDSGVGDGTGDVYDDILAIGSSGGIDDLIADVDGVETVTMKKQGKVEIQQPSKMTGSQQAMGQRTPESLRSVLASQEGRIKYTFNKYLRRNPDLRGKISVDVTIEADGTVSRVSLVESTVNDPDFVRDIMTIVRRLKFPPISEGSVTVNLPFVFQRIE